jgi:cytochrome c-type biogenesis protein CcmE
VKATRKLLIGGIVIVVCLGFVAYQAARSSLVYYLTPTEFARKPELRSARVRLAGRVAPGSVARSDGIARFSVTDGVTVYPVRFAGALPDLFAEGREVLVEGRFDDANVLVASQVITTHPVEYKERNPERVQP